MRFCMVTTFYPPYSFGGDGILVHGLSNALARRGHQVEVVHCVDSYLALGSRVPEAAPTNHPNITIHALKSRAGMLSPVLTQQSGRPALKARKLRRIIENGEFDVIHYHNMSLMGISALELGDALKVYTLHEHWLVCPMHALFRFNREACPGKKCIRCTLAGGRPPQFWRFGSFLKRALRHVDAFLCPVRAIAEKHREMGLELPVVHLPQFLPESPDAGWRTGAGKKTAGGQPYFLYAGRLEKSKGLHTLIPAFRDRAGARLVIAGKGGYESELRRLARSTPNVEFLGHVDRGKVRELLGGALALVVPSVGHEVFPLVIVEAFAAGTPVIARRLGSLPEILAGGGGLTFAGDEELAQHLDRLAADRSLRRRLGAEALEIHGKEWTEEVHVRRYLELIASLGARGGALPGEAGPESSQAAAK